VYLYVYVRENAIVVSFANSPGLCVCVSVSVCVHMCACVDECVCVRLCVYKQSQTFS